MLLIIRSTTKKEIERLNSHYRKVMMIFGVCLKPIMLVMELLEGGSLRDKVKSGDHLTVTQRLRLCCDAAMGLGWLHKSNPMIIHRDFVSD